MWILVDCHSLNGGFLPHACRPGRHGDGMFEGELASTRRDAVQIAVDAAMSWAFTSALRHGSVLLQDPLDDAIGLVDTEVTRQPRELNRQPP